MRSCPNRFLIERENSLFQSQMVQEGPGPGQGIEPVQSFDVTDLKELIHNEKNTCLVVEK